jgi:CubicO group peptidase (beta-lactamase class C family)
MADTTYHPRPPSAEGTSRNPLTGELVPEPAHDTGAMAAAGQLWSTVGDLARWGHFLVSGADDVLSESTLAEMAVVQCADPDTQHQAGYGLGLRLFWRAHGTGVGHTGSMPGFMASLLVDRRSRVGSVILSNATTGVPVDSLPGALVAVAEADQSLPPQPAAEPAQAGSPERELEGNWYWGNTPMRVRATATGFTVDTETGSRQFRRVGDDRYLGLDGYYAGETLWVLRGADGVPAVMTVVTFIWTRTPYGSVQGLDSPKCAG